MDLKSVLPFLMAGNKNADSIMPIINMMTNNNNDKDDKNGSTAKETELLSKIMNGKNDRLPPNLITEALKNRKTIKNNIAGITPILGVVNDDILGKMVKYLSR